MKMLVHFNVDQSLALGVWWFDPILGIQNLYTDPNSPQAARGRTIMFSKTSDEVSWENWFDSLVERPPYFESWVAYDSMGMSAPQLLSALNAPRAS